MGKLSEGGATDTRFWSEYKHCLLNNEFDCDEVKGMVLFLYRIRLQEMKTYLKPLYLYYFKCRFFNTLTIQITYIHKIGSNHHVDFVLFIKLLTDFIELVVQYAMNLSS